MQVGWRLDADRVEERVVGWRLEADRVGSERRGRW